MPTPDSPSIHRHRCFRVAWIAQAPASDSAFLGVLRRHGALITTHAQSWTIDVSQIDTTPLLVILPLTEDFKAFREEVKRILMKNARVHFAARTDLEESRFHDACEGLGVLGRIPEHPGPEDALPLLERLHRVLSF